MAAPDLAALADAMARLAARPYAEVGVPMFLVAEDLRGEGRPGAGEAVLADALRAMEAARPAPADAARLVEVLADRHLLGPNGPAFTRLGEADDAS